MKATLEFNLNEPEDKIAHLQCVNADKIAILIWDIKQKIRAYVKYQEVEPERVIEYISELINESGLNEIIE